MNLSLSSPKPAIRPHFLFIEEKNRHKNCCPCTCKGFVPIAGVANKVKERSAGVSNSWPVGQPQLVQLCNPAQN